MTPLRFIGIFCLAIVGELVIEVTSYTMEVDHLKMSSHVHRACS